jgi:hypothetical protein
MSRSADEYYSIQYINVYYTYTDTNLKYRASIHQMYIYIYVYCMVYVYGILLTFCITLCHVDPQHLRAARNVKIWAEVLSAGSQAAVWTPRSQPCPQIRSTTVD